MGERTPITNKLKLVVRELLKRPTYRRGPFIITNDELLAYLGIKRKPRFRKPPARVTQEMLRAFTNKLMECGGTSIVSVLSDDVVRTCLAAALRTHAGESAAQSERAGLEREGDRG